MASRIAGITVEIGGDTTKLQTALKSVNTQIKSTQSQLKDVNKLLKLDPTNTTLLTQKQKLLTAAIADTQTKLPTLKTAAEQANEQLQKGDITQEQYDALQREIIATEQELQKLADEAAESNAALVKVSEAGEKLESVGDTISGVGEKLLGATTAVVALGTAAVTTTANFETAMSKVEALISSSSADLEGDMERLEEKARQAGETTKFSATEAAEAMSYMGLAGWSADEMIDGLDGVLNLAAASEMDLATASDIVTDYLSAFGLTAADSGALVDKMAYAMSNSNTSTEQLGEAYKNCAATATQLGYGLDETTAALMVMADAGIKGGEAGTALSSIMTRLGNNTSGCRDMLAEYGVEVYDSEGNVKSLSSILSGMQDVWAGLTDEQKSNLAYVVAGKTAQSELMTVLGESTGSFEQYTAGLSDCTGAAETMAETMQDNLSGQLTVLMSQLQELAISFGQILMPAVKDIVSKLQGFVDKLNNMDEGTKETIVKVGLLVAAIGPLLIVIGKAISTVGKAMQGFSSLGVSVLKVVNHIKTGTGMAGKLATAISGISAPILAVVAVIAVLVAAFKTLWDTNSEFREKIVSIWNDIVAKITSFVDGIKERLEALGISFEGVGGVLDVLKGVWTEFCNLLAPLFESAFSTISTILSTVLDVITGLFDLFIGVFTGDWQQAWTGVTEIFSGVWDGITSLFSIALETIKGVADVILGWFGTSWNEVWTGISTFFTGIWTGISTFFSGIMTSIQTVATTIWTAISTFFTTVFNSIYSVVSTVWTSVYNTITSVWNSVYSVIEPLVTAFGYLFETIFQAIQILIERAMNAIQNTITNIWNAVVSFLTPLLNGIQSTFSSVWNAITSAITTAVNAAKSTISSVWNAIKSLLSPILNSIKSNVSTAWNAIKSTTSSIFNSVKSVISSAWSSIKSTFSNALNSLKSTVSSKLSSIKTTFSNAFNSIKKLATSWGKDIIQNLINGIKSKISALSNAVTGVANKIKSILGFSLPEEGPLSDADTYMPDFMELLSQGIRDSMDGVVKETKAVAESISGVVTDALNLSDVDLQMPELALAGGGTTTTTNNNQNTTNLGGISVVVSGYNAQDDNALAKMVADKISDMFEEDNAVFQ